MSINLSKYEIIDNSDLKQCIIKYDYKFMISDLLSENIDDIFKQIMISSKGSINPNYLKTISLEILYNILNQYKFDADNGTYHNPYNFDDLMRKYFKQIFGYDMSTDIEQLYDKFTDDVHEIGMEFWDM